MTHLIAELRKLAAEGGDNDVLTVDRGWIRELLANMDAHASGLARMAETLMPSRGAE